MLPKNKYIFCFIINHADIIKHLMNFSLKKEFPVSGWKALHIYMFEYNESHVIFWPIIITPIWTAYPRPKQTIGSSTNYDTHPPILKGSIDIESTITNIIIISPKTMLVHLWPRYNVELLSVMFVCAYSLLWEESI